MQSNDNFSQLPDLDGISDNGLHFRYESEFISFAQGVASSDVRQLMATYYEGGFEMIQRANLVLDNIDAPGSISQAQRKSVRAEARALRALAYMRLTYLYGDLPLLKKFTNLEEVKKVSRTPKSEIVQFILDEFKGAADSLATSPYGNTKGRFTKQAALGFRAKTMLYEARMGKKTWSETLAAVNDALDAANSGGAGLFYSSTPGNGLANFEQLFYLANIDNKEIIFAVKNNDLDRVRSLYRYFGAGGGNLSISVHTNLVNDFYCTDGLPISTSPIYNSANPYNNRDPRLKASITAPGDTYSTGSQLRAFNGNSTIGVLQTNYAIKKMTTLNGLAQNQGELDFPLLRYAEVLLMKAEAENEVNNGPTTAAYSAINAVRARVLMPNVTANLSQAQFKNEVIHERRVELTFEGSRWFDLITLGIAAEKINAVNELGRKFVPNKQELFPIPLSEININPNLLPNNPGY